MWRSDWRSTENGAGEDTANKSVEDMARLHEANTGNIVKVFIAFSSSGEGRG